MVKVLKRLGVEVEFLENQTCCGQPAFNTGFRQDAKALAKRFISIFDQDGFIVSPSGSCTSMVRVFYKELFHDDQKTLDMVELLSTRTYEFSEFLVNVLKVEDVGAIYKGRVTYHDPCHALRELRIQNEPRKLIKSVKGIDFIEMRSPETCCGFGGTFSIKFPDVSVSILDEKIESVIESGADTVVSADMGCLMHIGGALNRRNIPVKTMHIAELLSNR